MLELGVGVAVWIVSFIAVYTFLTLHHPERKGKGLYLTWQ